MAVLAAIFARQGSFAGPQAFVDGVVPAVFVGAVVVAFGAVAAFAIPRARQAAAAAKVPLAEARRAVAEPQPVYVRADD